MEKSQMNKTREKIVIIENKLCIVLYVQQTVFCGIHSLKPTKMKMNAYESFLEFELQKGIQELTSVTTPWGHLKIHDHATRKIDNETIMKNYKYMLISVYTETHIVSLSFDLKMTIRKSN